MPVNENFRLNWVAGASANVELLRKDKKSKKRKSSYRLKYTPPFRSTLRPPLEDLALTDQTLDSINEQLNELVKTLDARSMPAADNAVAPGAEESSPLEKMKLLGEMLFDLLISPYAQADLRLEGLFLDIGMDEYLLNYPWELMHDGDNFLCLKHMVGRFVNDAQTGIPANQPPLTQLGTGMEKLSILLISVPEPEARGEQRYDKLPEAEAETDAIKELLAGKEGVELSALYGKKATYNNVYQALKKGTYQIVHFNGHAAFNDKEPLRSALVLYDRDMPTFDVWRFFSLSPPILYFINACETARIAETSAWSDRYNIFGLARAFLDTGAYLLGSRWKINDQAAKVFATPFYNAFVLEGKSLGRSIVEARVACKEEVPADEFAWASYVLYGDPRVCFSRT